MNNEEKIKESEEKIKELEEENSKLKQQLEDKTNQLNKYICKKNNYNNQKNKNYHPRMCYRNNYIPTPEQKKNFLKKNFWWFLFGKR